MTICNQIQEDLINQICQEDITEGYPDQQGLNAVYTGFNQGDLDLVGISQIVLKNIEAEVEYHLEFFLKRGFQFLDLSACHGIL